MKKKAQWIMQEPGWHTKEGVGGVCRESVGWGAYPWKPWSRDNDCPSKIFKTMQKAMRWLEREEKARLKYIY